MNEATDTYFLRFGPRTAQIFVSHKTFTKLLAQILSRDISFCDIVATRKVYFNTIGITLTIALTINPTLTPTLNLNPTLTLTQAVKNSQNLVLGAIRYVHDDARRVSCEHRDVVTSTLVSRSSFCVRGANEG